MLLGGLLVQLCAQDLRIHQEACGAEVCAQAVVLVEAARRAATGGVTGSPAALAAPGGAVGVGRGVRMVARRGVVAVVRGAGALRGQRGLSAQQRALLPGGLDRAGEKNQRVREQSKTLKQRRYTPWALKTTLGLLLMAQ